MPLSEKSVRHGPSINDDILSIFFQNLKLLKRVYCSHSIRILFQFLFLRFFSKSDLTFERLFLDAVTLCMDKLTFFAWIWLKKLWRELQKYGATKLQNKHRHRHRLRHTHTHTQTHTQRYTQTYTDTQTHTNTHRHTHCHSHKNKSDFFYLFYTFKSYAKEQNQVNSFVVKTFNDI